MIYHKGEKKRKKPVRVFEIEFVSMHMRTLLYMHAYVEWDIIQVEYTYIYIYICLTTTTLK